MKTIAILTLFFSLSLLSCTNRIIFPSHECGECQTYYQFIKDNWVDDGNYYFHFKGNPEYWTGLYSKYFKEKCLIGLTKKEIIKLFGIPTQEFESIRQRLDLYIYCMTKKCCKTIDDRTGNRLTIVFDSAGKVKKISIRPPPITAF